jgi:hypothetical protein
MHEEKMMANEIIIFGGLNFFLNIHECTNR